MLKCSDETLYIGCTKDLENRVNLHQRGQGAKYTRGRRPVCLVYSEYFEHFSDALKREKKLQKLPRHKRIKLLINHVV